MPPRICIKSTELIFPCTDPDLPLHLIRLAPRVGSGQATFPSEGKAWMRCAFRREAGPGASVKTCSKICGAIRGSLPTKCRVVGRQAALPRMPLAGLLTRRPAKGAAT